MTGRLDTRAVAAAGAAVLVWSSAFAGVSEVVTKGGYTPGEAALLRFIVASAAMAALALPRRVRLPHRRDLPRVIGAALVGITVYHLAFNYGETRVSASASSLIIALGPVFTALLAMALLREHINGWGWAGVALAFSGAATIAIGEGSGGLAIEPMTLVTLLAAVTTSVYHVLAKEPLRHMGSIEFTAWAIWIGTIPLLVFAPGLARALPHAPAWSTLTVAYLGVFPGAVAYLLWSYALARMPASTTASFLYGQPVLATLVAWGWQGVVPSWLTVAGGGLALAGVALVQVRGRPAETIVVVDARSAVDRAAVRELVAELFDHFGVLFPGMDRSWQDEEWERFDDWYAPPSGRAYVATVDGVPAGCVAIRDSGEGAAELRRLYVRPAFRRRGIARLLLRAAMEGARDARYRRMRFVTMESFEGAVALYESEGFERIEPFRESRIEGALTFGRDL